MSPVKQKPKKSLEAQLPHRNVENSENEDVENLQLDNEVPLQVSPVKKKRKNSSQPVINEHSGNDDLEDSVLEFEVEK